MTYTVKNISKGCSISVGGSGIFVGIAGLIGFDVSGEKSKTGDATSLDSGQFDLNDPTGYSSTAVIKGNGFYDHTVYAAIEALVLAPVPTAVVVTYAAATPTTATYSATGFGVDKKVEMGKFQMADFEFVTTGAPS